MLYMCTLWVFCLCGLLGQLLCMCCPAHCAQHMCLCIPDPEQASKAWRVCCRVWARQQLSSVTLGFLHCGVELFCWLDEGMHEIEVQAHSVPTAAS